MKWLALFLVGVLAGCAVVESGDQVWYKAGASESERQAAQAAAELQAKHAQVPLPEERGIFLRAMMAQGWKLTPKADAPPLKANPPLPLRPRPPAHQTLL